MSTHVESLHVTDAGVVEPSPIRRLGGLLVAQFFGAFNDNAWKMILFTLATRPLLKAAELGSVEYDRLAQVEATQAFLWFTVPMLLLSLPAGVLADRVSKRTVVVWTKVFELMVMSLAAMLLYVRPGELAMPFVLLGMMGLHSAMFGPAKYGILPELLPHEKLSWGNGLLEMLSMAAIIAGTGVGPLLLVFDRQGQAAQWTWLAPLMLAFFSLVGLAAALNVPHVRPAAVQGVRPGVFAAIGASVQDVRADRVLWLAVIGQVVYWTVTAMLGQGLIVYTDTITVAMKHGELMGGVPPACYGVGIAVGALIAARWSGARVELGLIPLGAMAFALFAMLFGAIEPRFGPAIALVAMMGIGAGVLVVPLNAVIQWRAPAQRRGSVIALTNVLTLAGMIAGSLAVLGLSELQVGSGRIMLIASLAVLVGTCWSLWLLPEALTRFVLIVLTHTFYRLKVVNASHVPQEGGALLVSNHMTFVDGLFIMASVDRPVRFIVDASYYNAWWARPFMRWLRAIPVSAGGGPRVVLGALRDAGKFLDQGELVCIFAEGQISRTGTLMPLRRGMQRIVRGRGVPVIPVHLDRAWGSIFSYSGGRFVRKVPRRVPLPITVSYGAALPADVPLWQVRQAIATLGVEAWTHRRHSHRPLHRAFIKTVRRGPWKFAFADASGKKYSRLAAMAGAVALGRKLRQLWQGQTHVGIMLPPSVAGTLVNIAAACGAKVSVNLNYTTGPAALGGAAEQAGLQTVVTSLAFLEKAKVQLPQGLRVIHLEDVAAQINAVDRWAALLLVLLAPTQWIERACGAAYRPQLDDDLTVIFSSGSTGEPKGVVLTHANLDANVEGVAQVFHLDHRDKMLGILPTFHSFGYMLTWFAATHGIGVVFQPNPLDAAAVGSLVLKHRLSVLIATPTFLLLYMRRCEPGAFGSLRVVLTGAEKLPPRLADAFEQHFGLRPIEGYGTTECSPVVAVNTIGVRTPGIYQPGSRRGTVGQPLPNVLVRVVDPDTFDPLPSDTPGMLLVKAPSVMRGYLNRDDLTGHAMHHGWYVTGDIAKVDEDGFITITDRLSRFSKIGGEMVPHGKVEEALHEAAGVKLPTFAVTAVPDEKKGERLAVLHTYPESRIGDVVAKLGATGLPNLYIPRADQFIKVEAIPYLGTGKLDLCTMKRIAMERLGAVGDSSARG